MPARCVFLRVRCPGPFVSCPPVCALRPLRCLCGVPGLLGPVQRCARSVCCVVRAVSWATWLLFTSMPARCVVLCVRHPGPLGSCSPLWPLRLLLCSCSVLGHLAPVHWCARSLWCVARAVSWTAWLLFNAVRAPSFALPVRCPGPLRSCLPVCQLCVLCRARGVLGLLAPIHRCARWACPVACTLSWAPRLLFTFVLAGCAVLGVRCPGPLGSCSLVCSLGVLCCGLRVRGVAAGRSLVHPDDGCS